MVKSKTKRKEGKIANYPVRAQRSYQKAEDIKPDDKYTDFSIGGEAHIRYKNPPKPEPILGFVRKIMDKIKGVM